MLAKRCLPSLSWALALFALVANAHHQLVLLARIMGTRQGRRVPLPPVAFAGMDKVVISGGPADGSLTGPGERFQWIEMVPVKRSERTPSAGLYELTDGRYEYIGGNHQCGCGAVFQRAEGGAERQQCPVCGV